MLDFTRIGEAPTMAQKPQKRADHGLFMLAGH